MPLIIRSVASKSFPLSNLCTRITRGWKVGKGSVPADDENWQEQNRGVRIMNFRAEINKSCAGAKQSRAAAKMWIWQNGHLNFTLQHNKALKLAGFKSLCSLILILEPFSQNKKRSLITLDDLKTKWVKRYFEPEQLENIFDHIPLMEKLESRVAACIIGVASASNSN